MNVLGLNLGKAAFDAVLSGDKTEEVREIRPTNAKRYFRYLHDGVTYEDVYEIPEDDKEITLVPVPYDAIRFYEGKGADAARPWALVEVKEAEVYILSDEQGEPITYEWKGETYLGAEIEYKLGSVLERSE